MWCWDSSSDPNVHWAVTLTLNCPQCPIALPSLCQGGLLWETTRSTEARCKLDGEDRQWDGAREGPAGKRETRGAGGSGHRACGAQGSIPGVFIDVKLGFLLLSSVEFMMGESRLAQELRGSGSMCEALGSTPTTPVHPDPHQNQSLSSPFILPIPASQSFFFTTLFSSFPKTHIWIT